VGNFDTPFSPIGRSSRQRINMEASELNDNTDQMNLTGIYTLVQPKLIEYTFFSAAHGTFFKIGILGNKANLKKHKKIENFLYFIRPQWNKTRNQLQEKLHKTLKHMETEQLSFNDQWVIKEIKGKIKNS
jgi:hypothetical protein